MAQRNVTLRRIGAMSAFRVGLAFSVVGLIAWLLAVCLLWFGLEQAGIVDQVNSLITDVGSDVTVTFGMVLSATALVGAVTAILATILCPILALIYNATVELFGGLYLRLSSL
ncbi:membrane protein [Corynebacterium phocae]|uniref:Membrane protein n=1 Tax=Corynebacterium phocae TaxID=161895 RepID=A0A1L7D0N1_9CORY|nr:DUF3566 domain-containing protein [Corynebacterium phocae]APT91592.1 membrane protein [Corynebacterium phocae]KAA8720660.1 DUF3566 domain-containing protein [Corynebacterium phocae]